MTGHVNTRARLRINCVAITDILLNDMASSNMIGHFQVSEDSVYLNIMNISKYEFTFIARRFNRLWKAFTSTGLSISDSCSSR